MWKLNVFVQYVQVVMHPGCVCVRVHHMCLCVCGYVSTMDRVSGV